MKYTVSGQKAQRGDKVHLSEEMVLTLDGVKIAGLDSNVWTTQDKAPPDDRGYSPAYEVVLKHRDLYEVERDA